VAGIGATIADMATLTTEPARPRSFTTAGVPPEDRIELWQEHNSVELMGLQCRTLSDAEFEGATVNVALTHAHLGRVRAETAHVIERRADLIRRHPEDSVVLFFVLAGEAFFYHADGVRTLRPGQLVACDADRPFMRGFSNGFKDMFLKVPRRVLLQRTGIEQIDTPVVAEFADGTDTLAASLAHAVDIATRWDSTEVPDEDTLLTTVCALLEPRDHAVRAPYLVAARSYIDSRLGDQSLSATTTAAAVGISPRHLSRVFAQTGLTVPQYVLAKRLESALALLRRPEAASMSIDDIACRCGFRSATYFSRSFADRFGERASEVRRRATAQRAVAQPPAGDTR
jgi:AraC-like DNA-binding protein